MNNFEDLKEYSFIDLAKSKVTNLMTMGKSGIDKAKSFLEEREDAVEIIVKSVIIVAGICVAIKDVISDKKLKSSVNYEGKSGSRWFCFFVDVFNVVKRVL